MSLILAVDVFEGLYFRLIFFDFLEIFLNYSRDSCGIRFEWFDHALNAFGVFRSCKGENPVFQRFCSFCKWSFFGWNDKCQIIELSCNVFPMSSSIK